MQDDHARDDIDRLMPKEYTTGPHWEIADFEHSNLEKLQEQIDAKWTDWAFEK